MKKQVLQVGTEAPDFNAIDVSGKKIQLRGYASSYVLVSFLRYSGCPWCNLAVHRLAVEQQILSDSNCQNIVFIQSSIENIEQNIIKRHSVTPGFPIIPDPDMAIYAKYNVTPSVKITLKHAITNVPHWVNAVYKEGYKQTAIDGNLFVAPATFLIAPGTQKIIRIDYNANLYDHQSFSNIYQAIANHKIHGFATPE